MARYAMQGLGQTSNNVLFSHQVMTPGATPRRFRIFDMMFGFAGAAADGTFYLSITRASGSAGTTTSAVPTPVDPADAACITLGGITTTTNPTTVIPIVMNMTFNQRSTVRWFAAPGEELVAPLTVTSGFGVMPVSPSPTAANIAATIIFDE